MSPDVNEPWPHQFSKNGKATELGKDEFGYPVMAQPYSCVHCYTEYTSNVQPKPTNPCPARYTRREMKRVKNG